MTVSAAAVGVKIRTVLAAWTDWFSDHPELAEWGVAAGTLALAIATVALAWQARAEA